MHLCKSKGTRTFTQSHKLPTTAGYGFYVVAFFEYYLNTLCEWGIDIVVLV